MAKLTELTAIASAINDLVAISKLSTTVFITATTISASDADNSFYDSANGFITAGFAVGDSVNVTGFTGDVSNNIFSGRITALTSGRMDIGGAPGNALIADAAGESVTIRKWVSYRCTVADLQNTRLINSQSAAYTLVESDKNAIIYHPSADTTARTWTIPSNASVPYPIGTQIVFDNDAGAGALTIAINTDTLVLISAGTTGSRTLASGGQATATKVTSTRWRISGVGLS